MNNRVLLNTQRKELHDILVGQGIDPAVTKWTNDGKGWTQSNVDTLEAGLCHFLFNPNSDGTLSLHFKPSLDGGASFGVINHTWKEALNLFTMWTKWVKRELSQEDPWLMYSTYLPPERLGGTTDNSPFTHQEAEHVASSLVIFLNHVRIELPEYSKVSQQFDPQFERLAYQAKNGAGRIDWSNQFVGMLISLCMALSLSPDAASALWHFWSQVIDGLLLS